MYMRCGMQTCITVHPNTHACVNTRTHKRTPVRSHHAPGMSMMGMTSKGSTQSSWMPNFSRSLGFFFKSCKGAPRQRAAAGGMLSVCV